MTERAAPETDKIKPQAAQAAAAHPAAWRPDYCWVVLAAGTLAVFGALGLGRFGYTVVLPAMQQGLAMDTPRRARWPP